MGGQGESDCPPPRWHLLGRCDSHLMMSLTSYYSFPGLTFFPHKMERNPIPWP
jgi:hypothetical protein